MARWRCGLTRTNRRTIAALIAVSALLVALVSGDAQVSPSAAPPVAIEVRTEPIAAFDVRDSSLRQFGLLEFRGGLVLRSSYRHFGGISAIRVAPDGAHFIALTDKGWWFRGRILYEGTRPSGIADAEMAPILGADGRPLAARGWYDTESIAEDGGTLYVGIERVHQIVRFNYGKEGLLARGRPIALPPGLRSLPPTGGSRPWFSFRRACRSPVRWSRSPSAASTRRATSLASSSGERAPAISRSGEARTTTSRMPRSCPAATFCCSNADSAGAAVWPCACAASRSARSSRARWLTAPFYSTSISAMRSTIWKA